MVYYYTIIPYNIRSIYYLRFKKPGSVLSKPPFRKGFEMIDRHSAIPLYHQIKEDIIATINTKELQPGQKIAGEHEFAKKYDVSQITIRKALSDLVADGYLVRARGKGTFVSKERHKHKTSFHSFTEEMKRLGYESTIKLLEISSETNARIAKKLNLSKTEKFIKVKRVRLGSGEPFGLQTSYVLARYVDIKAFEDFEQIGSLYKVLQSVNIEPKRIHEIYKVALAGDSEAQKLLEIPATAPVFCVEHYAYNEDGDIFEYTESVLRGDKYELETEIHKFH